MTETWLDQKEDPNCQNSTLLGYQPMSSCLVLCDICATAIINYFTYYQHESIDAKCWLLFKVFQRNRDVVCVLEYALHLT